MIIPVIIAVISGLGLLQFHMTRNNKVAGVTMIVADLYVLYQIYLGGMLLLANQEVDLLALGVSFAIAISTTIAVYIVGNMSKGNVGTNNSEQSPDDLFEGL